MTIDGILAIHFGALGDVVAAFPALLRLKAVHGPICMVCQNNIGSLARHLDIADQWFPLEAAAFASLYSSHVHRLAKEILLSFPKIILFSGSSSFEKTLRSITENDIFRIRPRPDSDQKIHVGRHILSHLIKYKLLEESSEEKSFPLSQTIHGDRRNSDYHPSKIFIHPGSGSRKKCWPIENFIKTASLMETMGFRPEYIFGPAEYDLFATLSHRKSLNAVAHKIDTLTELAQLLKTGAGFIGNDSGVSHLSAFLGLPTIAVFGPSDPEVWKPAGRAVKILRPDSVCSPCFDSGTTGCEEMECFNGILPEDILAALFSLIC